MNEKNYVLVSKEKLLKRYLIGDRKEECISVDEGKSYFIPKDYYEELKNLEIFKRVYEANKGILNADCIDNIDLIEYKGDKPTYYKTLSLIDTKLNELALLLIKIDTAQRLQIFEEILDDNGIEYNKVNTTAIYDTLKENYNKLIKKIKL